MDTTQSTLVLVQCNKSDPLAGWLAASQDVLSNQFKWLLCWQKGSPCICEESILRRSLLLLSSTEEYWLDLTVSFHLPKLAVFRTGPPCALQSTALICIRAIVRKTLHCYVIAAICITTIFKQALHCNNIVVICIINMQMTWELTCLSLYKQPGVTSDVVLERLLLAEMKSVSDFHLKSIPHFAKMFVNWWPERGRTEW